MLKMFISCFMEHSNRIDGKTTTDEEPAMKFMETPEMDELTSIVKGLVGEDLLTYGLLFLNG